MAEAGVQLVGNTDRRFHIQGRMSCTHRQNKNKVTTTATHRLMNAHVLRLVVSNRLCIAIYAPQNVGTIMISPASWTHSNIVVLGLSRSCGTSSKSIRDTGLMEYTESFGGNKNHRLRPYAIVFMAAMCQWCGAPVPDAPAKKWEKNGKWCLVRSCPASSVPSCLS